MPGPARPEQKMCWNCAARSGHVPVHLHLCLDCWRMVIITAGLFGGGAEAVHQILQKLRVLD